MNADLTSTTTNVKHQAPSRLTMAMLGVTLISAAAVGVATWQSAGHTKSVNTGAASDQPVTAAVSPPDAGSASLPRANDGRIVYIVRSQAEAQVLRSLAADLRQAGIAVGQRSAIVEVLVSGLDRVTIAELDGATIAQQLPHTPGTVFMDLRTN